MSVDSWEHFFKPEVRSSGRTLFSQGKVSISQPSDTEIVAYIRVSSSFKVVLKSPSMSSQIITTDCNCPAGKKGLFCKHIWAALLAAEAKNSDFFDSKTELEKSVSKPKVKEATKLNDQSQARAQEHEVKKAAYKEKQDLYRKIQYQKQKLRQQDYKLKKGQPQEVEFPNDVGRALTYFSVNGIELKNSMSKESISSAKKTLARVFHPDSGGSHEEIVELNKFAEILSDYVCRQRRS